MGKGITNEILIWIFLIFLFVVFVMLIIVVGRNLPQFVKEIVSTGSLL